MSNTISTLHDLEQIKNEYIKNTSQYKYQVLICGGAGCISSDCAQVKNTVIEEIKKYNLEKDVSVYETGCMGICAVGPVMLVLPERTFYTEVTPESAINIVESHIVGGQILIENTYYDKSLQKHVPKIDDIEFFKDQVKIALRNCGIVEHNSIDAYIAHDGYLAAYKVITQKLLKKL